MTVEDRLEQNEKLVHFTLHRSFPEIADDEDFQQIGRIALWNACRTYDSRHGEFSTYAVVCIRRAILKELTRQNTKGRKGVTLSLQHPLEETDGITLEDALCGDTDVCWVDLQGFLDSLSDQQRRIVASKMAGLSQQEIAKDIGVSQTAVCHSVQRMRRLIDQYV